MQRQRLCRVRAAPTIANVPQERGPDVKSSHLTAPITIPCSFLDPVVIFGGIAMMVIGVMMVVKGISVYIPAMGPVRGGLFPLVGLIVVAAGLFFFTMPRRRKKKEQAQKEAAGKE